MKASIEIDGIDVRRVGLDELRSRIAVVLQEPFLLPRDRCRQHRDWQSHARRQRKSVPQPMRPAPREFIDRLPAGYDTLLGERGSTLSGGQRHRIAIARAFVRHASIVILDEPTAALDAATETELMASFKRLTQGRTSIVISHRLSTIRDADRIIVLSEGRVVESGTPAELLARRGHFYRLHQAAYFGAVDGQVERMNRWWIRLLALALPYWRGARSSFSA